MASIDFEEYAGPPTDGLGIGLLGVHLAVGFYVLVGWIVSSAPVLFIYLLLLPMIAAQWRFNQGCCVLNNLESRLRFGCWRHPHNKQEGAFLLMLCDWCFRIRPSPLMLDRLSYGVVAALWFVGLLHLGELMTG
jgi:hypothetical protein